MKRLLMLGGSHFQAPSIKAAVNMGHYVITCDYLPDNPGHRFANEYHNVSTTDKDAVLQLAKRLKVDGIVCYASDPAAPTAAYVCEQLNLPTSPYKSVEILSNKALYRQFLSKNGFNTPKAKGYTDINEAIKNINKYKLPVLIKPVDSSGSKGVTLLTSIDNMVPQIEYALQFSRSKTFIIEEFVKKESYQIAGDGFSVNGKLAFRCFANEHFDTESKNPFVPIGESFPYIGDKKIYESVDNEVQRLIKLLNMQTGAYNFDIRVDGNGNVFLMEIGPRNGGNLIPQVIKYATGVDLVEYTIKAALGEDCTELKPVNVDGFWSCYMVHSENAGILKKIEIEENFKNNNIVECDIYAKIGDTVTSFTGSNGTIGTMILRFSSQDEMLTKMDKMRDWVKIIVE